MKVARLFRFLPGCLEFKISNRHFLCASWLGLCWLGGCARVDQRTGQNQPENDDLSITSHGQNEPWFIDCSNQWGLDFQFKSGHLNEHRFPEIMGGGGAVLDFDSDGWLDLYLVQAGGWDNSRTDHPRNVLYRNSGDGRLIDVSASSGTQDSGYGMGACAGDYNGDRLVDIYVTNVGKNVLLRNNGDGTFSDETDQAGVGDTGWGTSAAFVDVDGDGWLDLYVCNYLHWYIQSDQRCFHATGRNDYCGPLSYNDPQQDVLYRNNGDGTFTDITLQSGIGSAKGNGLGVVIGDVNSDGSPDILVANDMTPNLLWINDGNGGFSNQAAQFGCSVDNDGLSKAGMGICLADVAGNGLLDLLVVNLDGQSDSFYENHGKFFVDRTARYGLAAASLPFTRFGVGFHDFNHDGALDLFAACGRVMLPDNPTDASDPYAESNLLFAGTGNRGFRRLMDGDAGDVSMRATSRAALFCDLDNNGSLEIVVVNKDSPSQLLASPSPPTNCWIGFDVLESNGSHALGAIVRITLDSGIVMRRDVNPHYSYLASNDPRVHFGVAQFAQIQQVDVTWRDGSSSQFGKFDSNRYYTLQRH